MREQKLVKLIQGAVELKLTVLDKATELLREMESDHMRGTDWVPLDDANCHALRVLEKLEMIQVIKFNDGHYYGQVKGVEL